MAIPQYPTRKLNQRGYTLVELMVAVGISGFLFFALMSLLSQSTNFAAYFNGAAASVEGASEAIAQLNSIMPQVVRVRACGCQGASSTFATNCTWSEPSSSDPNIGKDPVQTWYNNATQAANGLEIFTGDFEWFSGNIPSTSLGTISALYKSNISAASVGGCTETNSPPDSTVATVTGTTPKGCKVPVRLFYMSPVMENVSYAGAPSTPGYLRILVGNQSESNATAGLWIGRGSSARNGENGIEVAQLSCGFVQAAGQTSGMLFALNLKIKSRSSSMNTVTSSDYESWHPSGKNFFRGTVRDLRFKYSFRNLSTRGVYQWRVQGTRNCKENGASAIDKSQCCSLAMNGSGQCQACVKAGQVGYATQCCSEQNFAGVCL